MTIIVWPVELSVSPNFGPTLTQDRWVLEAVSLGVRTPFLERPTVAFCLENLQMSEKMVAICDEEIKALIEKGAIKEVASPDQRFVSGLFVTSKSLGGYRPIINLKRLNRTVEQSIFEGIGVLKELIREDCFCKIDLKGAYLTIPSTHTTRKFFSSGGGGRVINFCL